MKIVLVVGTTEVQEDSVEEGNTDEKVVKSNDRHLLATLKRLRESRAAEDIQSVDDDVVFALPVFGGLISTSKSVSQKKQPSEAASSRAVSMRVLRELPAAPASPVPRAPIMVTAHMQELEEVEDATAISETIAPLPPTPEKETSPHYADVDPIHPDRRPVGRICTDIRPKDPEAGEVNLPEGQAKAEFAQYGPLSDVAYADRGWSCRMYQWEATKLRHRPLYFEEINAERYGYSCCPIAQPVISAAHFFAVVPVLPYKMAGQPSRECIYTLGYYRPGSCVPYQIHWPPLRPTAGLIEAGVITGLIFAIP